LIKYVAKMEKKERNTNTIRSNANTIGFDDFLLSEYSNIAQAHFKSTETISTFFRYYILILSFPISALGVFFQISTEKHEILKYMLKYKVPISIVLFSVAFIGIGMFAYIISLRFDALLYARTVNGIRKHFYKKSSYDLNYKLQIRVLPESTQLPGYYEPQLFWAIIFVFGLLNAIYIYLPLYLLLLENIKSLKSSPSWCWLSPSTIILAASVVFVALVIFLHWRFYCWLAKKRENSYLRSNIIGVDIDGVLNKHIEQFCNILKEQTGKSIDPSSIITIQVHKNSELDVSKEEEESVFNELRYWTEMPPMEKASHFINKLREIYHLKTFIFAYRPWQLEGKTKGWLKTFSRQLSLKKITEKWLKDNKFTYNRFILETDDEYSYYPSKKTLNIFKKTSNIFKKTSNRFYISRKYRVRFFVEDELEKAIKLSNICDVVFLISHPYNELGNSVDKRTDMNRIDELPDNIVGVQSWEEIYKYIRNLL